MWGSLWEFVLEKLFSKPFALSIGPQACGANILHDYFRSREDVVLPHVREIFYFDRHIQRGSEFYKEHFRDSHNAALFMELTTTAFDHPEAPRRVKDLLGRDVKLFCPLRDPVERSLAVYRQYLRYGIVKGGIEDACMLAPQILHASRYADHLEAWVSEFEALYFLTFEDLENNREQVLKDLCVYLDVPFKPLSQKFKVPKFFPQVWLPLERGKDADKEAKAWLSKELEGECQRVETLLDQPVFSQ